MVSELSPIVGQPAGVTEGEAVSWKYSVRVKQKHRTFSFATALSGAPLRHSSSQPVKTDKEVRLVSTQYRLYYCRDNAGQRGLVSCLQEGRLPRTEPQSWAGW